MTLEERGPRPRADLATYQLDDELVVYDPQSGQSFVLNATGQAIWALCDGGRSSAAIAAELSAAFGVSADLVLPDVTALLGALRDANLLAEQSSSPA